jgi:hypothetical protein
VDAEGLVEFRLILGPDLSDLHIAPRLTYGPLTVKSVSVVWDTDKFMCQSSARDDL